ncbi:methyl-accepting chemotaxis protein [Undibacterium sp. 5I1]|uniref:methyl-accepting chemotaxis protein n=1 Tax=unclassified Undibacterium TaxID=2630295 RepID=UPI002AB4EEC1|nr:MULTISPECIES: methyl-accepting chemotaxis protein [unclassified Undibacterium]MDY7540020.1 methyl-accepting chemotaxis protein [Undibacterium sp. 5I1]MEB0232474.1 methyl-accepting chemotaxis protein [Undibacterium sp. 10I3]MEB0257867.1 methyl-accepting chemotaxis protein [Undibacterium sp. 5I1]
MKNMKIGLRLGGGFGAVLLMMVMLAAVGVFQLIHISTIVDTLVQEEWVKEEQANIISSNANDNMNLTLQMFITSDTASMYRIQQNIENHKKNITNALEILTKLVRQPVAMQLLSKLKESRAVYVASFSKINQHLMSGKKDDALILMEAEMNPALNAYMENIAQFKQLSKNIVDEKGAEIRATVSFTEKAIIGISIFALLTSLVFAYLVTRSITRPILYAVKIAQTVAAGDLTEKIEVKSTDETGQLITALKDMNEKLLAIVSQVRAGSDHIATASSQIAAGNFDLSSRTEEQASSLEETASSMEELTSTVKQNSEHAQQASQLAISTSSIAIKGGDVVSQVIATMGLINDSAKKIVDIIGVIDSIAFQTNILALNAAVESARAGEQGRGFAVVASEVRSLAQRSAGAAKEIKSLINNTVERVGTGTDLVNQAGKTMDEVVRSVQRVTEFISEISVATLEQSAGIEQINRAVMQMDQVTQQNAALVEEATAAAQSMEDQSRNLVNVVSRFELTEDQSVTFTAPESSHRLVQLRESRKDIEIKRVSHQPNIKRFNTRSIEKSTEAALVRDRWEEF